MTDPASPRQVAPERVDPSDPAGTPSESAVRSMPAPPAPGPGPGPLTGLMVVPAVAALSACGGGGAAAPAPAASAGSGTASTPGDPATSTPPGTANPLAAPITAERAARFLQQAAFAATDAQIARVQAIGYSAWLDEQFNAPRTQSHWDWMVARGYNTSSFIDNFGGVDNTLWRKFIGSPDALRQRMTLALSEIFVISMNGLPVGWRGFLVAAYVDLLESRAFGTYRELLQDITLSPAMGVYLNMRGNQRANLATGRLPDENYAREVLQLFSIGLLELSPDGTLRDGRAQETYTPATIAELARVFTGWEFDGFNRTEPGYTQRPMVNLAARHDNGAKSALGVSIPAGTPAPQALRMALDAIAGHPNVGPFLARQLIQRLVTSAPSPAYVGRVAAAFQNNGQGVRGDFKAVLKAILLDEEARRDPVPGDTTRGRLSEPVARFIQWARTFGLSSPTDLWNIGNLSDPATRLGQSPLRSPTVFNFFRPGYVPPNSELGRLGITAPEFEITDESSTIGWVNFAQTFVANGVGETRPSYDAELALAGDPAALVQRVARLMAPFGLSAATIGLITQAVSSVSATTEAGRRNRVQAAVLLVMASPEYLVHV